MRKIILNYYAIIILVLYLIYNILLNSLKIGGLFYQLIMVTFIIINAIILIIHRKDIKYKEAVCVIYFVTWLWSKNISQCLFNFSNIIVIVLISIGLSKNKFRKIFSTIIISLVLSLFFIIFVISSGISIGEESGRNDIYKNMHYYCENNYEVYAFSHGSTDKFHYSIGKYYDILDIKSIIYVSYNKRNEVSNDKYEKYLNTHSCKLVYNINGSK